MARLSVPVLLAVLSVVSPLASCQAPGSTGPDCQRAILLAEGIQLNINDQNNEVSSLAAVSDALNTNDQVGFQTAKTNLLGFVNSGIEMRQMNQAIAPPGNKATAGLAIVANAQLEELNLSNSLSGDPANREADLRTIETLKADFAGGIKQNMQNMADAISGCGGLPPAGAAVGAPNSTAPVSGAPLGRRQTRRMVRRFFA
ncbi:hypothetical protein ACHAQA_004567 [Verticillium albo-atrum]